MLKNIDIWLERLSSLYKSQMRLAVSAEGFQLVNLEIMQYLSMCNVYSNTAQALSEYLGQTKGSISQSLKIMENSGHIARKVCEKDKRMMRIFLTEKGRLSLARMTKNLVTMPTEDPKISDGIQSLLKVWQAQHNHKGFGQCQSCRYHLAKDNAQFKCGLTDELLPVQEGLKLCREHDFNA
ncbi:MAG: hypothetical protein DHS20C09_22590 [marine bacterium B5-7]|nr:MAG: hypothetical protein DHS20C09_22590 [marine bacterium B5-7]